MFSLVTSHWYRYGIHIWCIGWCTWMKSNWRIVLVLSNCALDRCERVCSHFYACKSAKPMSDTAKVTMIAENLIVRHTIFMTFMNGKWCRDMNFDRKIQCSIAWISSRKKKNSILYTWSTDVVVWKVCTYFFTTTNWISLHRKWNRMIALRFTCRRIQNRNYFHFIGKKWSSLCLMDALVFFLAFGNK